MLVSVSGLVAVALAGYLLNLPRGLERYSWLFGFGIVAGVTALFLAGRIPGGAPVKQTQSFLRSQLELLEPLRNPFPSRAKTPVR